ncbi:MAG TPA: glycosyltransferase family 61 protein, partial [Caulobacteraceae bacterium]|nr:glycosyltransferase family 61 protein [Caulobacteraceae bacterium]
MTPQRCERRALGSLFNGVLEDAETAALDLIQRIPDNAAAWAALRGVLTAQDRPADAAALRLLAPEPTPGMDAVIDCIAGRRLSKRGLLFDPDERFAVRPMMEVLQEVPTSAALRSGQNVVWFQDKGGELVERRPVLDLGGAAGPEFPVRYRTAAKFVASMRNAAVVGLTLVLSEDGEFLKEIHSPSKPQKYEASWDGGKLAFPPPVNGRGQLQVKVFDTPAFLMGGPTDTSFGDFLVNFATRLALYEAAGLDCPILLRWKPLPPVLSILEAMGVGSDRIIFHAPEQISLFPKLYAPCWPCRDKFAPIAGVFDVFRRAAAPPGPERPMLYLDRRNNRKRALANEPEVAELFAARGFKIVEPGSLSFEEVRQLFAAPACVAGVYGSAFLNLVFSNAHPPSLV